MTSDPPRTSEVGGVVASGAWTTELQRTGEPPAPMTFLFFVEDELIRLVAQDDRSSFRRDVYEPWLAFLQDHHPELRRLVLALHRLDPEPTQGAMELLPQAFEDYAAWLASLDG